jgi:hypothetical protein
MLTTSPAQSVKTLVTLIVHFPYARNDMLTAILRAASTCSKLIEVRAQANGNSQYTIYSLTMSLALTRGSWIKQFSYMQRPSLDPD